MARTPTDPTKAQVWITKEDAELDFEFYFPQGPKGDPGGFNAATVLSSTVNLDDLKTPGLYRQTTATNATALLNYPLLSSGALAIYEAANTGEVIQKFMPYGGGSAAVVRTIFWRRFFGGAWSSWINYSSQRIDQSAGRTVYIWDHLNSREQMIYGDTGWRSIATDATYGIDAAGSYFGPPQTSAAITAADLQLRRIGNVVYLATTRAIQPKQDYSPSTNRLCILPPGFRSSGRSDSPIVKWGNNGGDSGQKLCFLNPAGDWNNPAYVSVVPLIDSNWGGFATGGTWPRLYAGVWAVGSWLTNEPWPTSLPGVSNGTIPNI